MTELMNKELSKVSLSDFNEIRRIIGIVLSSSYNSTKIPLARSWSETGLHKELVTKLQFIYNTPKAFQMQTIPASLMFKDIMGISPTGSGKTVAFLAPLLNFLKYMPIIPKEKHMEGPYAIVLGPTRELVIQLHSVFEKISPYPFIRSKVFIGGREKYSIADLSCEVVFATVGRMRDLIENNDISLNQCCYVIIDEADAMIRENLSTDLEYILDSINDERNKSNDSSQVLRQETEMSDFDNIYKVTQIYSATMPSELMEIAKKFLRCPMTIAIEEQKERFKRDHLFDLVPEDREGSNLELKINMLLHWLKRLEPRP